ncbi:hypothetical protein H4R33_005567 [Dimargaris cristalligena]|uniref:Extracellular membrane protein CFEM domain-containing protein n=1 Tax=Dimargaris cristalligena TaxID=215637 RepID=A0A4P9ZNS3_9FUNG|nr:hypothetical protein H4R33_005567 [Dimargaris cristalligena]RKP33970.1 hypothetical protein BJ085DRAFT_39595 [Dimargaris cristalligena]|eukprot:RKP33970.1 hypothetical protein BJ085DRAFT_39595 [Dimargaris cristalligena]
MKFFATVVALAAAAAVSVQAECASQAVVDSCLATTGASLSACAFGDFTCQCQAQSSVVACYDSCPDDDVNKNLKTLADSTKQNFCGHATAMESLSSATHIQTTASVATVSGSASNQPKATGSASAAAKSSSSSEDDDSSSADSKRPALTTAAAVAALVFAAHAY